MHHLLAVRSVIIHALVRGRTQRRAPPRGLSAPESRNARPSAAAECTSGATRAAGDDEPWSRRRQKWEKLMEPGRPLQAPVSVMQATPPDAGKRSLSKSVTAPSPAAPVSIRLPARSGSRIACTTPHLAMS